MTTATLTNTSLTTASWNAMYEANARPLLRFLLRLTLGDRERAEDHLQETFLRAWRWLQGHPTDVGTLRPWLFTVARRVAIDAARSRALRPTDLIGDELSEVPVTSDEIDRFVQAHTVRDALRELSPEHRSVLLELYYRGLTAREAAVALGIPEGTVKSRAHYALHALRANLKPH